MAGLVAVLLAVVVGVVVYQSRITASLQGDAPFSDAFPDTFATVARIEHRQVSLAPVEAVVATLYTPMPQTGRIGMQVRDDAGRLLGKGSFAPADVMTGADGGEYRLRMPLLAGANTIDTCILFRDAQGGRLALRKTSTQRNDYDSDRRIVELGPEEDCDSVFGSAPRPEDVAAMREAFVFADYEARTPYAVLRGIKPPFSGAVQDETVFQLRAVGPDGGLPKQVELVIETGPDGVRWPDSEILRAGAEWRYASEYTFHRDLDRFVRACVSTAYLGDQILAHEMIFEREAGGGFLKVGEKGPALKADADHCRTSLDPANGLIGETAVGTPLDEALPMEDGAGDRPGIGGIHLGMAFDEAVTRARAALPKATHRSVSPPAEMLTYGGVVDFGDITRLEDAQRGRVIVLMRHMQPGGGATVGAIFFSAKFDRGKMPSFQGIEERAQQLFGTETLRRTGRFNDAVQMYWSELDRRQCSFSDLSRSRPIGVSYVNRDSCGTEIYLNAAYDHVDVGLYDFTAMGAPAE